ncbi:substrate-binding domain-containing protein, partial [Streptomyces sp. NK15101]|uniref:substrate-binding domain-containing protein n=1 Tax=Streptomyces sp. NK15101 TaxID=2873261 RepID=UPI001CEC4BA1
PLPAPPAAAAAAAPPALGAPPLTSVRQPIEEMGRTMARMLLQEIASPSEADEQPRRMLPTELVVRASS